VEELRVRALPVVARTFGKEGPAFEEARVVGVVEEEPLNGGGREAKAEG